jgi:[ribosomal protein S18]-alanine N-acetyltransferase
MSKRKLDASSGAFSQVLGLQRERKAYDESSSTEKRKLARWQSVQREQPGTGGRAAEALAAAPEMRAAAPPPVQHRRSRAWSTAREVELDSGGQRCVVRPLTASDVPALRDFGLQALSETSRAFFAPYNWTLPSLSDELSAAAANSLSHRDLHLVAVLDEQIIGYAFLWSIAETVPELGLAVADAWQRKGLGRAMLLLLCQIAQAEGRWAVELTTMQDNKAALNAYEKAGFEQLGMIRNPLGCDVTAAFAGEATPTGFADEYQMVKVLNRSKCAEVMSLLGAKRERAKTLFGVPTNGNAKR